MATSLATIKGRALFLLGAVLIAGAGVGWVALGGRTPNPTSLTPEVGGSASNSETLVSRLDLEPADREPASESRAGTEATPKVSTSPSASPSNPKVLLWGLENVFQEYERGPNWHVAQRLLIEYIKVDMDSKGRSEIVTPATAGKPFPPPDPNKGFFAAMDPRGDRRYHFTREDYPEWFDLISPPSTDTITGKQDGPAQFAKLSPELAGRIRTLASAAIEAHRGQ